MQVYVYFFHKYIFKIFSLNMFIRYQSILYLEIYFKSLCKTIIVVKGNICILSLNPSNLISLYVKSQLILQVFMISVLKDWRLLPPVTGTVSSLWTFY